MVSIILIKQIEIFFIYRLKIREFIYLLCIIKKDAMLMSDKALIIITTAIRIVIPMENVCIRNPIMLHQRPILLLLVSQWMAFISMVDI